MTRAKRTKLIPEMETRLPELDDRRGPADFEARHHEKKELLLEKKINHRFPAQPSFLSQHPSLGMLFKIEHALSPKIYLHNWNAIDNRWYRFFRAKSQRKEHEKRLSIRENNLHDEIQEYFKRVDKAHHHRWENLRVDAAAISDHFVEDRKEAFDKTRPRIEREKEEAFDKKIERSEAHVALNLEAKEYTPKMMVVTHNTHKNTVLREIGKRPTTQVLWALGIIENNYQTTLNLEKSHKATAYQNTVIEERREAWKIDDRFRDIALERKIKASDATALYSFLADQRSIEIEKNSFPPERFESDINSAKIKSLADVSVTDKVQKESEPEDKRSELSDERPEQVDEKISEDDFRKKLLQRVKNAS